MSIFENKENNLAKMFSTIKKFKDQGGKFDMRGVEGEINSFEDLKPLITTDILGCKKVNFSFENGLTLSVVGGDPYYGDGINDWEVAVLDANFELMSLSKFGDFAGNIDGWCSEEQVTEWIQRVKDFMDQ